MSDAITCVCGREFKLQQHAAMHYGNCPDAVHHGLLPGHEKRTIARKRGRPRTLGNGVRLEVRLPVEVYTELATEANIMNHGNVSERARAILHEHFERKQQ